MHILGLIPLNFAELTEAVLIEMDDVHLSKYVLSSDCSSHRPNAMPAARI